MSPYVKKLYIYPVKSLTGVAVEEVGICENGLDGDRQFVVVNDKGKFLTARQYPDMMLLTATITQHGLSLSSPTGDTILTEEKSRSESLENVKIWNDNVTGSDMGDEAAAWLSRQMKRPCRLLSITKDSLRHSKYSDTPKSFADAAPVLLTTDSSLSDLNSRLKTPVSHLHFRPNIVVSGDMEPFAEDLWATVKVGDVVLDVAWGCSRCIMTSVNPETGKRSADKEPVKTLRSFRTAPDKQFYFGQNAIPQNKSVIRIGDTVEIISVRKQPQYRT